MTSAVVKPNPRNMQFAARMEDLMKEFDDVEAAWIIADMQAWIMLLEVEKGDPTS